MAAKPVGTLRFAHPQLAGPPVWARDSSGSDGDPGFRYAASGLRFLSNHVHAIWTLSPDDHDYSGRRRAIKAGFTRAVRARGVSVHRNRRGEYEVWQRRFWEHLIRDGTDLTRHVDYIHFNPVKHGLAPRPVDWPWSSLHRYIRQGIAPPDWAVGVDQGQFGE